MEKAVNRVGIVLLPKEPCSTWLKEHLGEFYTTDTCKIFLLDLIDGDFKTDQLPGLIQSHYERMFAEVLDSYTSKKFWPEITYEVFQEWFEVRYDAPVSDLGTTTPEILA